MPVEALEEEEAEAVVHPRTQEAATKRASCEQVSRLTESPQCRVTSSFSGEYNLFFKRAKGKNLALS